MSVVIKVENVSKLYRLGSIGTGSLNQDINRWWAKVRGREDPTLKIAVTNTLTTNNRLPITDNQKLSTPNSQLSTPNSQLPTPNSRLSTPNSQLPTPNSQLPTPNSGYVWALKDINFEVNHGEAIGIIGKNGAGKSTILKILSKVTAPTSGQIKTKGRIASLLEVGTGFHPELTGRENIFLNGAILGMTKTEISRKLEEIIAFSGVEKYIDTPVKRYSSGMYVRLAFAVAAYLEPEILIVDEVLAVGDLEFQDKCLGKMNDVSKNEGRTVIFVSHNMNAIQSLCSRSLYISSGRIMRNGPTNEVVAFYKEDISNFKFTADAAISDTTQRRGNGKCRFTKIEIKNKQGEKVQSFEYGEPIIMELEFIVLEDMKELATAIVLRSGRNKEDITDFFSKLPFKQLKAGSTYKFNINIDSPDIRPGDYILYFWLGDISRRPYDVVDGVTPPINIYSTKSYIELGFDPSIFTGYFSLKAKLTS